MYDPRDLFVDPILTGFSVGYQDQTLYGDRIFPITPVNTESGKYLVYDRSSWVIFPDRREPGTVANEVLGGKWSYDTFFTVEHSLQAPVLDEERQQLNSLGGLSQPLAGGADIDIDPERDATELVTRALLLGHEKKVADTVRNATNYPVANTVTLVGNDQWDSGDVASTPLSDIRVALRTLYAGTGRNANTMIIPRQGVEFLEEHSTVVTRFTNFRLTDPEAWRELTGFSGNIYLVDSVYNAADNIDAAEDITSFWGKDVWIGIVDQSPGQRTKTFGKTFAQTYPDGSVRPTDRWREVQRKADLVRVSFKYDLKIVSNVAGYLIKDAFSAGAF